MEILRKDLLIFLTPAIVLSLLSAALISILEIVIVFLIINVFDIARSVSCNIKRQTRSPTVI